MGQQSVRALQFRHDKNGPWVRGAGSRGPDDPLPVVPRGPPSSTGSGATAGVLLAGVSPVGLGVEATCERVGAQRRRARDGPDRAGSAARRPVRAVLCGRRYATRPRRRRAQPSRAARGTALAARGRRTPRSPSDRPLLVKAHLDTNAHNRRYVRTSRRSPSPELRGCGAAQRPLSPEVGVRGATRRRGWRARRCSRRGRAARPRGAPVPRVAPLAGCDGRA